MVVQVLVEEHVGEILVHTTYLPTQQRPVAKDLGHSAVYLNM